MMLFAAALRIGIELATALAMLRGPGPAAAARRGLEWLSRLAYFAGVPAWLTLRLLSN